MEQIAIKKIDSPENYFTYSQLMYDKWYECVTKGCCVLLCIKGTKETLVIFLTGKFGIYLNAAEFLKDIQFQPVKNLEISYKV